MAPTPTSVYTARHGPLMEFSLQIQFCPVLAPFHEKPERQSLGNKRTERLCAAASPNRPRDNWPRNLLTKEPPPTPALANTPLPFHPYRGHRPHRVQPREHADMSCDKTRHADERRGDRAASCQDWLRLCQPTDSSH